MLGGSTSPAEPGAILGPAAAEATAGVEVNSLAPEGGTGLLQARGLTVSALLGTEPANRAPSRAPPLGGSWKTMGLRALLTDPPAAVAAAADCTAVTGLCRNGCCSLLIELVTLLAECVIAAAGGWNRSGTPGGSGCASSWSTVSGSFCGWGC